MHDLEHIQIELEQTSNLLVLTREFLEEGMPLETDSERKWKLEVFCQRQDLLYTLIDTATDKLNDTITKTQELQSRC